MKLKRFIIDESTVIKNHKCIKLSSFKKYFEELTKKEQ